MAGTADAFDRKMAETITAITTRRNLPRNPYLKTRRHHKVPPPPQLVTSSQQISRN